MLARVAVGLVAAVVGCNGARDERASVTRLPVATFRATLQRSYAVTQTYTGRLVPRRAVELGFELDGKVATILVDEGDRVRKGDRVAVLDTTLLEADRTELEARRDEARSLLLELKNGPRPEVIAAARSDLKAEDAMASLLEAQLKRLKRLLDRGSVPEETYEEAEFRATAAAERRNAAQHKLDELLAGTRPERIAAQEAVVSRVEAGLARLAIRIGKSTLKAPFDGAIAQRRLDEGAAVKAGQPIVRLTESGAWETRIRLPVHVATNLAGTDRHEVVIGQKRHTAHLCSLLPELDADTQTVGAVLRIEATSSTLFAGELVRLSLTREVESEAAWVPTTCLVKGTRGLWSCYAVVPAPTESLFRVVRRDLELIHADVDRAYVRGTLQEGDRIILDGTHRVTAGQLVRLTVTE
jgi:RND family efflux transporter MFP subunit